MRIGEIATRTGVEVETVRYYEKAGLLPPPARQTNGYRAYGMAHLERLAFIRHCRALDIPLANIRELTRFMEKPPADCSGINALVDEQLRVVRARLKSLKALEKQLSLLRQRCTEGGRGKCGILEELVAAAHGEACACHG
ncbi:MAG: Cd(II)/Pb(II)-responsive transcriptional regulator [Burkholderiales bacterium]|nr:Cd(II)/Pb(II)-responsive transcriptional regulator [Burkholderiales bacterium]